jgi:hypothetical protein
MLFASRIAWRNEPVPLSLVFVTVKTDGNVTLFGCWLAPRMLAELERSPLRLFNVLAKLDANTIEVIDTRPTARAIRSAKARAELFAFFFILFLQMGFYG